MAGVLTLPAGMSAQCVHSMTFAREKGSVLAFDDRIGKLVLKNCFVIRCWPALCISITKPTTICTCCDGLASTPLGTGWAAIF